MVNNMSNLKEVSEIPTKEGTLFMVIWDDLGGEQIVDTFKIIQGNLCLYSGYVGIRAFLGKRDNLWQETIDNFKKGVIFEIIGNNDKKLGLQEIQKIQTTSLNRIYDLPTNNIPFIVAGKVSEELWAGTFKMVQGTLHIYNPEKERFIPLIDIVSDYRSFVANLVDNTIMYVEAN